MKRAGWLVGLAALVLAACGDEGAAKTGTLSLPVDPSLAPAQSAVGSRSVARMMGESGIAMDFFLGELIVTTDDQAKLDAFLARWSGTVVTSTDRLGDLAKVHHVRLDPSAADVAALLAEVNANAPDSRGSFRSTSDASAKLLAVALSEANKGGMTVSPNFVVPPAGIAEGTTVEAPTGDDGRYSANAFAWPYMNRGSAQDIGVGAAWQIMQRAGVFRNKVRIMILDGGFAQTPDTPVVRNIVGDWNAPNPSNCGGSPCPWHGTMVASAAMGRLDDGNGAAGPAAPVGELLAVPFQTDFFGLMSTLERILGATIFGNPRIINVSSSFELDLGWDIAVKIACLGLCPSPSEVVSGITLAVTASNKLIFASAGNQGKDVDNDGAGIEGSTTIPCESAGIICVGGMAHDSTSRDSGSNFGTKTGDDTVDIYGPFWTWVGSDPDNTSNHARLVAGTSFSSPFVAGVAALVWASKPDLRNDEVWAIVRDTAHTGGVHARGGNQRRVDARAAVARVLGGAPPSIVLNTAGPTAPVNSEWSVTAVVSDDGSACAPTACPLAFDPPPARIVGNTGFYRFGTLGPKTVTVTALDPVEQRVSASAAVNVVNTPPVVVISLPVAGGSVSRGSPVQFLGSATDANEGAGPGPGALPCVWTSSNAADVLSASSCNFDHVFATQGTRTITLTATDPQGQSASTTATITVTPPPLNLPPSITTNALPPRTYSAGYDATVAIALGSSATDPEGNTPIMYVWKATSFRPNSMVVSVADAAIGTSSNVSWTPRSTPGLIGGFAEFGNDCYDGQIVRIRVEATDSLGNKGTRTLPDIKVYGCILM